MRHGYQLTHTGIETAVGLRCRELRQVDAVARKHLLWQPARSTTAILPYILKDIRHLQTLRERHSELIQCRAVLRDPSGVAAEQFGEHLAHDPGDVVTVIIQVSRARQTAQ